MLPRSFFFGIETLIPHPEKSIASLCFTAESLSWICPGSPKLMPPTPGKDTINDIIILGYKIPAPLLQFGTTLKDNPSVEIQCSINQDLSCNVAE